MSNRNRFDIIIAGAGSAGVSLLWRILDSPRLKNRKILLIDQSFNSTGNKTWCFWDDLEMPAPNLLLRTWNKLQVRINGQTYSDSLKHYPYHCLRSEDFIDSILQKAGKSQRVTFLEATIYDFSNDADTGIVHTSMGTFEASDIFQSVIKPPGFDELRVDVSLLQHFAGWEIRCDRDLFDPDTLTFMDFDVLQKNGISFMYLLPFSGNRALIEYTVFSKKMLPKEEYENNITEYLKTAYHLNKEEFSVLGKEFGAIPMEDRRYPPRFCKHVLNIGTVGGMPKPSTGYTFSRIQKHSAAIVTALENENALPEHPISPYRFRVYDLMLLYLLEYETENSKQVFENLFKKNRFDRILQFLAEQTNPMQELAIFTGMPIAPFLRSVYKMKHRIFTGT